MAVAPRQLDLLDLRFYSQRAKIASQLHSLEERCRWLIREYGDDFPGLANNDRLMLLLYLRDFNRLEVPQIWLERASLREHSRIDNPWCILRALRRVKRDYMTEDEKVLNEIMEQAWHDVLAGAKVDDLWDLAHDLAEAHPDPPDEAKG